MTLDLFWSIFKYGGYAFIALLIYALWIIVIIPIHFRWRYSGYTNVYIKRRFVPFLGDFYPHVTDSMAGKAHYHHRKEMSKEMKKYDLKVSIEGTEPVIYIQSEKALKEFLAMQPSKIDRCNGVKSAFKLLQGSFLVEKSTKSIMHRRKTLTNLFGLNHSSKYLGLIIENAHMVLDKVERNVEVNMMPKLGKITFSIMAKILYGDDTEEVLNRPVQYENAKGVIEEISFDDLYYKVTYDLIMEFFHPIAILFPILDQKLLCNPFKRNYNNLITMKNTMRTLIAESKDKNSVLSILKGMNEFSEEDIFNDLILFMAAGTETSSHVLTSAMYFLKKYPDVFNKLKQELEDHGINKGTDFMENFNFDTIEELDYLSCVVKETLRFDTPVLDSLYYTAYEDIKICDVPIKAGQKLNIDLF
jgi:cytochrome P450